MTVLDANILLYAYNSESAHHADVRKWLEAQIRAKEALGLPWISLWAFLRISTNPRLSSPPLSLNEAFAIVHEILGMPRASVISPGRAHADLLERVSVEAQAGGARMTDATLAALAIEHGAKLASTDRDFARFKELKWVNPLG